MAPSNQIKRRFIKWKGLGVIFLILFFPLSAHLEERQYFYDALGRLAGESDGQGNAVIYNYDAAGNLLSITQSTDSPQILGISPSIIEAGRDIPITITGNNLSPSTVSVSNPDIIIGELVISNVDITATLTVPNPTQFEEGRVSDLANWLMRNAGVVNGISQFTYDENWNLYWILTRHFPKSLREMTKMAMGTQEADQVVGIQEAGNSPQALVER